STTAYQGYGRQLDMKMVQAMIDIAVGETRPNLTLLLTVPHEISELRRAVRQSILPFMRDRMEEGDRQFFARVENGFKAVAEAHQNRVRIVDGSAPVEVVCEKSWEIVHP